MLWLLIVRLKDALRWLRRVRLYRRPRLWHCVLRSQLPQSPSHITSWMLSRRLGSALTLDSFRQLVRRFGLLRLLNRALLLKTLLLLTPRLGSLRFGLALSGESRFLNLGLLSSLALV